MLLAPLCTVGLSCVLFQSQLGQGTLSRGSGFVIGFLWEVQAVLTFEQVNALWVERRRLETVLVKARAELRAHQAYTTRTGSKLWELVQEAQERVRVAEAEYLDCVSRLRCGAKNRKGCPCQHHPMKGKRRCKNHGGKSTGAKSPEGRARLREAGKRGRAAQRARASSAGA